MRGVTILPRGPPYPGIPRGSAEQQVGQLGHNGEQGTGVRELRRRRHRRVTEHRHPGRPRRRHPQPAVLHHGTPLRQHPHRAGRVQEQVRRRLPPPHVLRREDPLLPEPLVQPGLPQRHPDPLMPPGRRQAVRHPVRRQLLQDDGDTLDRLQLPLERREDTGVITRVEPLGQTPAAPLPDDIVHAVHRGTHEVPDRVLEGRREPGLGQAVRQDAVGDPLAVDENAVVVEDDQVVGHGHTVQGRRTQKSVSPRARHGG
ncbi:hypothetical protein SBRY_10003 [Actinacidiphila bryophytorum]|uniref:Uncharacterized protein n=1 Tax=Actinacidiphila bryophytorum TaxID=1436133 RepID=A0A9W4E149_9ACTN|nr:hypothetical protein SBRY_10003 [Actinacidiphila bryophytorum]